ncbi:MAG: CpaF family protein, partial [Alphaproteobacteria bacterium]
RLSDGRRKVTSVSELTGMEGETITMQEIFRFKKEGVDENGLVIGHFEATGIRPKFLLDAEAYGVKLPAELFRPEMKLS